MCGKATRSSSTLVCELGGVRSQGITRTGCTVLVRLMESRDLAHLGWICWVGSTKEQWCLSARLSPEIAALILAFPGLTLKLISLVPPCMSLAFFELLPLCWGLEQICEQGSQCVGPARGEPRSPAALPVTQIQSLLVLTVRC